MTWQTILLVIGVCYLIGAVVWWTWADAAVKNPKNRRQDDHP